MRKPEPLAPVVVPPEAEQALGLAPAPQPAAAAAAAVAPPPPPPQAPAGTVPVPVTPAAAAPVPAHEPEKSKTFFLPYAVCDRLEMQKLSERREMKYILRQALEEYFERHPLRPGIQDLYK
jgi:hypothetical protein